LESKKCLTNGDKKDAPIHEPISLVTAGGNHDDVTIISPGIPKHFDFLCADSKGNKLQISPDIWRSNEIENQQYFGEDGDYFFKISISGENIPTLHSILKVTWNNNWNDLKAEFVRNV